MRSRRTAPEILLLPLFAFGCSSPGVSRDAGPDADSIADAGEDGGGEDGGDGSTEGGGVDGGEDGGADADQGGPPVPGPVTLVATEVGLTTERLCDLDGDGDLDNAVADVAGPSADLILMTLNGLIEGIIGDGLRLILHAPLVDDLSRPTDPSIVLLDLHGLDDDDPADPSDDFSGDEPFYASARDLDACGEPRFSFASASLDAGALEAHDGSAIIPLSIVRFATMRRASFLGSVAPSGTAAEIQGCGALLIREIGDLPSVTSDSETSLLEALVAGGAPFGLPSIVGIDPDVDLDGDGLESFLLDDSSQIVACVDGDTTIIDGRGCWQDPRMADAFGVATLSRYVRATFLGREPGWEGRVEGTCDAPPEESLFDPR